LPTDTQFANDWLEERNRFDEAARNPTVEAAFLRFAQEHAPFNIIDIGAGNGGVFTYLSPKLPTEQNWTLVELNPTLLKRARQRLLLWANGNGYTVEKDEQDYLLFTRQARRLSIQLRQGSFLKLNQILPLEAYHAVTASAVADLLSRDMLEDLLQQLHRQQLAFYPTLNYQSMRYLPAKPQDEAMIEAYERHMQRQQNFGRALGPSCTTVLRELGTEIYGTSPVEGSSPWVLRPTDIAMHRHMLAFMEKSIPEIAPKLDVTGWADHKRQLLQSQQLHLNVEHTDFFIASSHA